MLFVICDIIQDCKVRLKQRFKLDTKSIKVGFGSVWFRSNPTG